MATPNERLASSLRELQKLQASGRNVFQANELSRVHKERLIESRFLLEVTRGWLISNDPGAKQGDSTGWYASLWEFCAAYCNNRFGDDWHLGIDQSLFLHAENTVVPHQLLVFSAAGSNTILNLPFGTSIYSIKERSPTPAEDLVIKDGVRIYTLDAGLIKAPENFFLRYPLEAQTCLSLTANVSPLLGRLLDGGNSTVAGRLAGAFQHIGLGGQAGEIIEGMAAGGYKIWPTDPFAKGVADRPVLQRGETAISGRLRALWASGRKTVLDHFPPPPSQKIDREQYLAAIDDIYVSDAYNSLSIEGYRVTPELIERVRSGNWDPENLDEDRKNLDALAARGYWDAFTKVKETVVRILQGENVGDLVEPELRAWYRELFRPAVTAGALKASALAGYRGSSVFLKTSRFLPPNHSRVDEAMQCLFELLRNEPEPAVRAVLGHWLVGYIHPFPDGNGRTARFLMNAMLVSGGYPWTVIRNENQAEYLKALDSASIDNDLEPFTRFVAESVTWSFENGFEFMAPGQALNIY